MQELIKAISWTLIHSLWQGLLAALLAAIVIGLTRRTSARLRYDFLGMIMVLFFTGTIITFFIQYSTLAKAGLENAINKSTRPINTGSSSTLIDNFISWVNLNSNYLVLAWAFCFVFSCLRLFTGLAAVNRLRHYKVKPVSEEWMDKLERLKQLIGLQRSVKLIQSELVKVPLALGNLKPVILLPLGLLSNLPVEQVETILLHELAHIRRRDYLVNLLQHIVESIFFFNPALRWISSLIREEREACCDDMVMAHCDQETNYFNALVNFQEFSMSPSSYAVAISTKKKYLLNRVRRMITKKNEGTSLFEKIALLGGIIIFSAFGLVTREKPVIRKTVLSIEQKSLPAGYPKVGGMQIHEIRNISILNRGRTDTLPEKNNIQKKVEKNNKAKPAKPYLSVQPGKPELPDQTGKPDQPQQVQVINSKNAADVTLKEIIKTKNEIGVKKEFIGVKKEQLVNKEGQEKNTIQKEIDKERHEVQKKRDELERLRAKWDALKKESLKDARPVKTTGKTIQKDTGNGEGNGKGDGNGGGWDLKAKESPPVPKAPAGPVKLKAPEAPLKKVSLGP